jgi:hypothetical protein
MAQFRIKRFTKDKDDEYSHVSKPHKLAGLAAAIGVSSAVGKLGRQKYDDIIDNMTENGFNDESDPQAKKLLDKLKKQYEDRVHIIDKKMNPISRSRNLWNSNFLEGESDKLSKDPKLKAELEDFLKKHPDGLPEVPRFLEDPEGWSRAMNEQGKYLNARRALGDSVELGHQNPATLSHELGHYEIRRNPFKGDQSKIRAALEHAGQSTPGTLANKFIGHNPLASLIVADKNGWKVDDEDDGKLKFNKKSLILPAIQAGLIMSQPLYEAGASSRGLRMLKELGASKEYLKKSEEMLKGKDSALSSYKMHAAKGMLANLGGYGAGLAMGHHRVENIKKKKEEDEMLEELGIK